jgi:hypothetical protein
MDKPDDKCIHQPLGWELTTGLSVQFLLSTGHFTAITRIGTEIKFLAQQIGVCTVRVDGMLEML